jgi:phosphopantothenoylcysteine decarboxylase/phosphopantothenate--cysteine ligase
VRHNIRKKHKRISILITAGPTREKIDPVRFISNYSTGTFGYEIAREAVSRGHDVTLVSGPTYIEVPEGVKLVKVESALEMRSEVKKRAVKCECVIMAAAVSDWRVWMPGKKKIKRLGICRMLELKENPDILQELGKNKKGILVGFALETEDLEDNALAKLKKKNLDLIVANKLTNKASLFGSGLTDVLMIDRFYNKKMYCRKTKKELAKIILDKALNIKI